MLLLQSLICGSVLFQAMSDTSEFGVSCKRDECHEYSMICFKPTGLLLIIIIVMIHLDYKVLSCLGSFNNISSTCLDLGNVHLQMYVKLT